MHMITMHLFNLFLDWQNTFFIFVSSVSVMWYISLHLCMSVNQTFLAFLASISLPFFLHCPCVLLNKSSASCLFSKQVKIFRNFEEHVLKDLVLKLRSQIFSPGDYIIREGEIGTCLALIALNTRLTISSTAKANKRHIPVEWLL